MRPWSAVHHLVQTYQSVDRRVCGFIAGESCLAICRVPVLPRKVSSSTVYCSEPALVVLDY